MDISEYPDAAIIVTRAGSIVDVNNLAVDLFGYDRDKFLGLPLEALVPKDVGRQHAALREKYHTNPMPRPMGEGRELHAVRSGGEEFPAEIAIGPIDDGDHVIAVIRDITSIMETRNALEQTLSDVARLRDQLQHESNYLREEIKAEHNFDEIIGNSRAIMASLEKVDLVSSSDATVLLLGETGTGKELVCRAIHDRSTRSGRSLIKVDCGTLPSGLIESELFGHERGAFTGAHDSKIGRFELANHGTILLDEIGELPLELQPKLLRVLEDGMFRRLGSNHEQEVDVRVIAATNRDLSIEMKNGRFRSDLYYRLSVFPIEIPPLRERREDIPLLVSFFASRGAVKFGKPINSIDEDSLEALTAYDWPGNVRELRNVIERSVILSSGDTLEVREHLGSAAAPSPAPSGILKQDLQAIERARIIRALEESGWKIKGDDNAASRLGLSPSSLRTRMKKLEITRP